MNILILGSGGREHALAWKLNESSICDQLFIAPGNAGTEQIGKNVLLDLDDFNGIANFVQLEKIAMIIVGPEKPLVNGIYDYFKKNHPEVKVLGPSKEASRLEGSKAFAKGFMEKYQIPTARYAEFTAATKEEAFKFIDNQQVPVVLKCDGLAAGKGVLILDDKEEAKNELADIFEGKFGEAGNTVVIEDFLDGIEFSVFALTNGIEYILLPVAKDYKRIGEGDTGLNTGGMGAISPPSFVDDLLMEKVMTRIIKPTIQGFITENYDYHGFVFFGLINVDGEPKVIEYNCRLGDPETEAVIPRIKSDLGTLFDSVFDDSFKNESIIISDNTAATMMLVSGGYPEAYEKDKVISSIPKSNAEIQIFHAGTLRKDDSLLTNGGRVIAITAQAPSIAKALAITKEIAEQIEFQGKYYRKDIGFDLV